MADQSDVGAWAWTEDVMARGQWHSHAADEATLSG
jgi:hypothetical protein